MNQLRDDKINNLHFTDSRNLKGDIIIPASMVVSDEMQSLSSNEFRLLLVLISLSTNTSLTVKTTLINLATLTGLKGSDRLPAMLTNLHNLSLISVKKRDSSNGKKSPVIEATIHPIDLYFKARPDKFEQGEI